MKTLKEQTVQALEALLTFLQNSPWRDQYYFSVKEMRMRLEEPCVLAVAGRVKAGKSSFINAFLGADLALTGTTETTATINYFRYGRPDNPDKPVHVIWTNDRESWESIDFLNSLQGNTLEVLERSNGIKRLEFFVDNPRLEHIRLVDTPGTGAIVGEDGDAHENVTQDFFNMHQKLRKKHSQETLQISSEADAVIYLNGAAVGQVSDASFLQDFQGNNAAIHSFNTIGVMSKIDLNDEILKNKETYAREMAEQYNKVLSLPIQVLPVSSGLQRFLDTHSDEEISALQEKLRSGFEPGRLSLALKSDKIFKSPALPGCSIPIEERLKMSQGIPWRVFVVISRTLASHTLADAKAELTELAGFKNVAHILESHFFKRGTLLRCHTILKAAYEFVQKLQRVDLYDYKKYFSEQQKLTGEYVDFVRSHQDFTDEGTGGKLLHFIARNMPTSQYEPLFAELENIKANFEDLLYNELASANRNFDGLRLLEEAGDNMSQDEQRELQLLFGLYPVEEGALTKEYCIKRQIFWRQLHFTSRSEQRKAIAGLAEVQYGRKVAQYLKQERAQ